MGAVGLSFGSPTSGQGFDVAATVTQIVTNLQTAESPYKAQLTSLQSQDTALSSLGGLLSTLSTDIAALTDPTGVLATKEGSSSDPNSVALTSADSTASAGTHTLTVSQLAQTSSIYSAAVRVSDTFSGSLSIQVGSGAAATVNVDPQNATLAGLAASINSAGVGVTASVITDATGARLTLVSGTSGAAGALTMSAAQLTDATTGASPIFTTAQAGRDASLVVDGVPVSSASNTVSGVVPGVTFQLLNTTSSPVQMVIASDTTSASSSISAFVKDYNAVVKAMTTQEGNDTNGNPEPLFGNSVIAAVQQQLSAVLATEGSGPIRNAAQLGIEVASDGTLTLNTDQLNAALTSQYGAVQSFFQSAGSFGLAMSQAVAASGSSAPTGAIAEAAKANASIESNLNSTISALETNIGKQKDQLTAELNAANQTLQLIPMQVNEVNEIYSAISGYSSTKS